MNAIIVGSGPVAEALGARLRDEGSSVTFVASDRPTAEGLSDLFPGALVLVGTGTSERALRQAQAEQCDVVFSIGSDDSHTLVSSLLARRMFGVKRVIALTSAAEDLPAFEALSINSVCAPTVLAQVLMDSVQAAT